MFGKDLILPLVGNSAKARDVFRYNKNGQPYTLPLYSCENGVLKNQQVVFVAYLSKNIPGRGNYQIIFDDVKLNTGNSYHVAHGNFVAPITGMYQFTITACSIAHHGIVLELTINSSVVDKVLAGDDSYNDCNTGVFFHRLNVGDDVYVKHTNQGDYLQSNGAYGRPMFTGLLLYVL